VIGRRKLIAVSGGAVAAWPLMATAQQAAMPVVGFLNGASPDTYAPMVAAFRQGLGEAGYVEGKNVAIEYRFAENQIDRLPALAADLVSRGVTAIATHANGAFAAKAATATVPIVFVLAEDPVKLGLVASLAQPGGNVTGINLVSAELTAKRLELLGQLVPAATRVAVLVNPANAMRAESTVRDLRAGAGATGRQIQVLNASNSREINAVFASFVGDRPNALFVGSDVLFASRRVQLALLAARHAIPAAYDSRQFPEIGGLMSYGANLTDAFRQMGGYIARILQGAKAAELPVVQSSKLELVINAETARMLGLAVPATLLATADEVIE
jgi:putative ABC transport system substrate-binding protein